MSTPGKATPTYRVGIDIGGTFTDFVIVNEADGSLRTAKTSTTPGDLWEGIDAGLRAAAVPLDDVVIAHGTTVSLNTLLERKGAPTGLLTTVGFRDAYEIGRGSRPELYNLHYRKPEPLVPRQHRLEARERLDAEGNVVTPLEEDDVRAAAEHFAEHGIRHVAVCFLHSYRNPEHELRAAEILRTADADLVVTTSHSLVREWREYERTSTTAINAYIMERTGDYIDSMQSALAEQGYVGRLFVNQSSGGAISVETARAKPVVTIMSGPAGGVAASAGIGALADFRDVIAFDMGGTSTDVSVIHQGRPRMTAEAKIDGHPVMVSMLAIESIGAGGGSIAWLDEVGSLNVGPRSAGAQPGPACYGRGGTEPTVTDANLLLGRVAPREFLPQDLELVPAAAEEALAAIGRPLSLSPLEAAAGVIDIVNIKMAMAVRAVTIQRGLDPKDFALFAFGGAGAMHACWIARELKIPQVVVPVAAGQFSALGVLLSDIRHDFVRTVVAADAELTATFLEELFGSIEDEASGALKQEGVDPQDMQFVRLMEARYVGQEYTLGVPVGTGRLDEQTIDHVRARFHELHERTYGHSSADEPIELVNARVEATGRLPKATLPQLPVGTAEPPTGARLQDHELCVDVESGYQRCPVWDRTRLLSGNELKGPAVVADVGSTTVLPHAVTAVVHPQGHLVVDVSDEQA
jgi:N-methylhydantoinase A